MDMIWYDDMWAYLYTGYDFSYLVNDWIELWLKLSLDIELLFEYYCSLFETFTG